jgi:hypothetical protein
VANAIRVTITDAEAAAVWRRTLGQSHSVPIRPALPKRVDLPRLGPTWCYFLALDELDLYQRGRLEQYLAERVSLSTDEVSQDIDQAGVPIRASTCLLPISRGMFQ